MTPLYGREAGNPLQAIIVFSDGRITEGSPDALAQLRERAALAKPPIPIIVVAVGEDRPQVRIDIADLRVPQQVRPDDVFRVSATIIGEGLPDKEATAYLEISNAKKDEDLVVNNVKAGKPEPIVLPRKIVLQEKVKFSKSAGGLAEVEFAIDAAKLVAAAEKAVEPGAKLELADSAWQFELRVPKDDGEIFDKPEHRSEPAIMQVVKRPLRILLFAGEPTRDYQFCRSLFVRETEKNRAELCIRLQPAGGQTDKQTNIVQIDPPERLLDRFPDRFGGDIKDEGKFYNLEYYDLIIAFDVDWNQLGADQLEMVRRWVDQGGGLVTEGGPLNTLQLARPGPLREKFKPILTLYPVLLTDIRIHELDRTTADPWRFHFPGVSRETEFLRLDDDSPNPAEITGWREFFDGAAKGDSAKANPERGFYNYYPVEKAKEGATVVATFTDPRARLVDGSEQPYIVTMIYGSGRTVWLGSGETWRLRNYRESYHEALLDQAGTPGCRRQRRQAEHPRHPGDGPRLQGQKLRQHRGQDYRPGQKTAGTGSQA